MLVYQRVSFFLGICYETAILWPTRWQATGFWLTQFWAHEKFVMFNPGDRDEAPSDQPPSMLWIVLGGLNNNPPLSGWWFETFFYVSIYIGNNTPNWLIFFRGLKPTTSYFGSTLSLMWLLLFQSHAQFRTLWSRWTLCVWTHSGCGVVEPAKQL